MEVEKFNITCKACGSSNVELYGYCGQNTGYGILECQDCKIEEEVEG